MADKIKVMAAKQDSTVVLWETHPDHVSEDNPTGEVFISGDGQSCEVGLTREVQKRLTDGRLVQVNTGPLAWLKPPGDEGDPPAPPPADPPPAPTGDPSGKAEDAPAATTKKAKGGD